MKRILMVVMGVLAVAVVQQGMAGTKTWEGDESGLWNVAGNWEENAVPGNGDDLVFPAGPTRLVITNDIVMAAVSFAQVQFTGTADGYVLRGNDLRVTGADGQDVYAAPTVGDVTLDVDIVGTTAAELNLYFENDSVTFNGTVTANGTQKLKCDGGAGEWIFNDTISCGILQVAAWGAGGTVYLNGNNAIAGRTVLVRGTLVGGHANAFNGKKIQVYQASGGTYGAILDLNGYDHNQKVQFMYGNWGGAWPPVPIVKNSSSTPVTVNNDIILIADYVPEIDGPGSITFSDVVTGPSGLVKKGSGTLTLSSVASDYTGTTDIEVGTLKVTGTHTGGGAYTVADGAILTGDGTIGPAVTVQDGGTILPGDDAPGTLTVSELTLDDDAVFGWRHTAAGGSSVAVSTADGLSLGSSLTLDLRHTGGSFGPTDEFALIAYSGAADETLPGTVTYQTAASSEYIDTSSAALSTEGSYAVTLSGVDGTLPVPQFEQWGCKLPIDLPGYTQSETLNNFPVLVALSESIPGFDYDDFLNGDHNDLRFSDRWQQTALKYEVETWNTSGTSYVWVAVGSLVDADVETTRIWAHWGKADETAPSDAAQTWDGNFKLVWHLDETSGNFADATANDNDGVPDNFSWVSKAGIAGKGQGFDGDNDIVNEGTDNDLDGFGAMTLEVWMRADTYPPEGKISQAVSKEQCYQVSVAHVTGGEKRAHVGIFDAEGDNLQKFVFKGGSPGLQLSTWYFIAGTWDGSDLKSYLDGVPTEVASYSVGTVSGNIDTQTGTDFQASYWHSSNSAVDPFDGNIDEVRVSNKVRSPSWIWATHENIRNNAAFATFGTVEKKCSGTLFLLR